MSVLLIDGRSGSGKTTLAAELGLPVLHMDELYPGWQGLAAAAASLAGVLDSRRYRRWDWHAMAFADWHDLPEHLIVEGVGSITAASRQRADAAVWLDLDPATRKWRALDRDGDTFAPHWTDWAAQEEALLAAERPQELADLVLDVAGAPFEELVAAARALLAP